MKRSTGDVPSLGVLVTGGIGVLVVIAFVAAIALGSETRSGPGDRVAVVRSGEPVGLRVLAGRCPDERVMAVEVRTPGGPPLWRIESDRGTIDRFFDVGAEPPTFFATVVALQPLPPGELEAEVVVDDIVDVTRFDPARVAAPEGVLAVPCGDRDLGLVPLLFILVGAGVVAAYAAMVARFLRGR